jgi:hypothetical protein
LVSVDNFSLELVLAFAVVAKEREAAERRMVAMMAKDLLAFMVVFLVGEMFFP